MSNTITPTVFYRTLNVEGLEIFYREAGPRDAPAVLLLHGFPSSSHMFRNLIPMLADVAKAIVKIVDMPFGTRPFRVHIDPAQDGAEIVNGVADRVRAELLRNMQLADLLRPSSTKVPAQKAS
jgi:pimeloyl-ACP methyl ester carboxylesterase